MNSEKKTCLFLKNEKFFGNNFFSKILFPPAPLEDDNGSDLRFLADCDVAAPPGGGGGGTDGLGVLPPLDEPSVLVPSS